MFKITIKLNRDAHKFVTRYVGAESASDAVHAVSEPLSKVVGVERMWE